MSNMQGLTSSFMRTIIILPTSLAPPSTSLALPTSLVLLDHWRFEDLPSHECPGHLMQQADIYFFQVMNAQVTFLLGSTYYRPT